ncbi:50S ribosomal protein L6 [Leadbetterella byssophila]|jgi:large subunit ribosomal protein L6|uniref:Large ribosomal subunit protein uL6 n=1 Tax=Leadbetterella byssophila (strain DSM 17132 / JCM 16389 / KACC 11308 / NBRC 106382 / 4M15) TaxID=649349 RepID=E4RQR5_LEAB4|nr:50S ribosomal protein L6 [Leadbetterella byssophila]ADQ17521.1 LSU ribosomal protein L6P [Leadbetterella byssophila DSM 17132]
MSRIGKKPINIPAGVTVTVADGNVITAKGPKGQLQQKIDADLKVSIEDGILTVERPTEQKRHKALHGLSRTLINNLVEGVSTGFKKELELVGVGYKATNNGNVIDMSLGYSHNIIFVVPSEISVATRMEKGKNPIITLEGNDKQLLGMVCAKIRSLRKIEPYKGKGIRFVGEVVRRKAGKTAGKK